MRIPLIFTLFVLFASASVASDLHVYRGPFRKTAPWADRTRGAAEVSRCLAVFDISPDSPLPFEARMRIVVFQISNSRREQYEFLPGGLAFAAKYVSLRYI